MSLRKAVKDVLDTDESLKQWRLAKLENSTVQWAHLINTYSDSIKALRQAYAEPYVPIHDLDDIAYRCDADGDWVVDLHEVRAIVERLSKPYVPMTEIDRYRIKDSHEYATSGELRKIAIVEAAVLARLGIEVGK